MGLKVEGWRNQIQKTTNEGQLPYHPHLNLASCFLIKDCQVEYELWQSANLQISVVAIILFAPKHPNSEDKKT